MGMVGKKRKRMKKKVMKGKNRTNQGEWAIHYIFKKLWKKREKKLRRTTLALHPWKVMKGKKHIQLAFHLHSPQDTKKINKKPHSPSPKYIVGYCSKYGLSTHNFNIFINFAPSLTSKHIRRNKNPIPSPKLLKCPHIYKVVNGLFNKKFVDSV